MKTNEVFQMRKKKSKKKKKEEKENGKPRHFTLKPEHSPRGIWRKPLKPGALSQLVGSHRLSVRYMGGWAEFSEL